MDSPSFRINFAGKPPRIKSNGFCSSCAMITFSKLPKPRPPIILPMGSSSQSSFNSSRDSAAIVRSRVAFFGGSPETGTHGAARRGARRAAPCIHAVYIRGYLIMGTTRTHDGWTWRRRSGEGRGGGGSGAQHTMRYGSQKIREPDMRARHVARRINEGCV